MRYIDLNCDMGESFGCYELGRDAEMMPLISSANIACGFHAGDPSVMRRTVSLAARHGVGIGAHPGFPDLAGFGRRDMRMEADELRDALIYQISALMGFAQALGTRVRHVKPHGALYNMAANDEPMARAIVTAISELDANLILVGLAGSQLLKIAQAGGLNAIGEVFADRAYHADGRLVSRKTPGAVLTDSAVVAERVVKMVNERKVTTLEGVECELDFETVCLHGDTAGAVEHARAIVERLRRDGVQIMPFSAK
ncbi:hypothetical protein U14_05689 [Candidatus Moduliflexus flocculans]|uniref:5-oxoprolinase subunit A n=1 Tax=Candidatus Moduliflexus flocculans TaxID=1499966 RepID=A0A081BSM3_9BACT|nr:hypothetical protein U14_05689 [Candidatus Moduliflexus flocculans]